ncbi:hypothetical protein B7989_04505 [Fibrobacter sp. UWB5]|nr:hypothetical protein B7989_04505 [Fibrobacter sp. UWB5]
MPHYRMVLAPVARLNLEKPRSALALINLKFFGSILLDLRPNVEIRGPFLKGVKLFSKNVLLIRERDWTTSSFHFARRPPLITREGWDKAFTSFQALPFGLRPLAVILNCALFATLSRS